ncbi:MAG TPA: hypothetical protein PKJ02_01265 [Candidatus Avimonas sp.]|nr:hypothetical protein [Candidatus Avimonas sp.]
MVIGTPFFSEYALAQSIVCLTQSALKKIDGRLFTQITSSIDNFWIIFYFQPYGTTVRLVSCK